MTSGATRESSRDGWLDRKFEDGRVTTDCRYPDCTDEPEPRRPGKSGPPSKFCVNHNNRRDRQFTARAEEKAERDRAAADAGDEAPAAAEPLPQVLDRRAHNLAVLAELGPRLVTAVQTIVDAQQKLLDTEAVADHIATVQQQAHAEVQKADASRAAAVRDAATAHKGMLFALLAAVAAVAERDAAHKEAATSQREAATANTEATAARTALEDLTAQHQNLSDAHHELNTGYEQLAAQEREQNRNHRALQETYGELAAQAGRHAGELSALRPQLTQLTERSQSLEEKLRTAAADVAAATTRIESLQGQLSAEQAERTRERDEHRRALDKLRVQQEERHQETERLRAQIAVLSNPQDDNRPVSEPSAEETTATETDTRPADIPVQETFPAPGSDAIELGMHDGTTWVMEPEPGHPGRFRLLANGTAVGTLAPAMRGSRTTGQWQATHRRRKLTPVTGLRFPDHTTGICAVMEAEAAHRPLPPADASAWATIPPHLRTQLSGAAMNINPAQGHIAQLEPAAYSTALAAAIKAARGTGRISPRHLTVLLDAPRADFGPPSHERAQRLYDVLQQTREHIISGQAT